MQTITIGADERIMIPKKVREKLGWTAGVILIYDVVGDTVTLRNLRPEDL